MNSEDFFTEEAMWRKIHELRAAGYACDWYKDYYYDNGLFITYYSVIWQ